MKKLAFITLVSAALCATTLSAQASTDAQSTPAVSYLPQSGAYVGLLTSSLTTDFGGYDQFFGFLGGYQFNPHFALEGRARFDVIGLFQLYSIMGKAMLPVSKRVSLYAGAGASYLYVKNIFDENKDGLGKFAPMTAVGVQFDLTDHFAMDLSSTQNYLPAGIYLFTVGVGLSYHFA
jgi:opacity protein-like surface antigen